MIDVMTRSLLNERPVSRIRTSIRPSSKRFRRVGANPASRYVELPRKNSAVCNVLSVPAQAGRRRRERSAGRKPTEYLRNTRRRGGRDLPPTASRRRRAHRIRTEE